MNGQSLAWLLAVALAGSALGGVAQAEARVVSIGTGGQTGVYYLAGQALCRFLNRGAAGHGIRCGAPASGGVANVNGLRGGEFDFAIMQAGHRYKALHGLAPFEAAGALGEIRALFTLPSEVFTLLARRDARIADLDDLKGKRVNIGKPGSGQRDALEEIMRGKGWDSAVFALAAESKAAEQASRAG